MNNNTLWFQCNSRLWDTFVYSIIFTRFYITTKISRKKPVASPNSTDDNHYMWLSFKVRQPALTKTNMVHIIVNFVDLILTNLKSTCQPHQNSATLTAPNIVDWSLAWILELASPRNSTHRRLPASQLTTALVPVMPQWSTISLPMFSWDCWQDMYMSLTYITYMYVTYITNYMRMWKSSYCKLPTLLSLLHLWSLKCHWTRVRTILTVYVPVIPEEQNCYIEECEIWFKHFQQLSNTRNRQIKHSNCSWAKPPSRKQMHLWFTIDSMHESWERASRPDEPLTPTTSAPSFMMSK